MIKQNLATVRTNLYYLHASKISSSYVENRKKISSILHKNGKLCVFFSKNENLKFQIKEVHFPKRRMWYQFQYEEWRQFPWLFSTANVFQLNSSVHILILEKLE